jgi:hypothetical protein
MPFTPNGSILRHQNGEQTDIFQWLRSIQPVDPFDDVRSMLPLAEGPETPVAPREPEAIPNGPINPTAACPLTGRRLTLYILRDLSCAILRDTADGGLPEVLPASLCLISQAHSAEAMAMDFLDRSERDEKLSFYARPDGIYWKSHRSNVTPVEVSELISRAMVTMTASILAADPIVDPRAHANMPAGTRYAPFSRWPDHAEDAPGLIRLTRLVQALGDLHSARPGYQNIGITVMHHLPPTPWHQGSVGRTIWGDKSLVRTLRDVLNQDHHTIDQNILFGPSSKQLLRISDPECPVSGHEKLARIKVLAELVPHFDTSSLL